MYNRYYNRYLQPRFADTVEKSHQLTGENKMYDESRNYAYGGYEHGGYPHPQHFQHPQHPNHYAYGGYSHGGYPHPHDEHHPHFAGGGWFSALKGLGNNLFNTGKNLYNTVSPYVNQAMPYAQQAYNAYNQGGRQGLGDYARQMFPQFAGAMENAASSGQLGSGVQNAYRTALPYVNQAYNAYNQGGTQGLANYGRNLLGNRLGLNF